MIYIERTPAAPLRDCIRLLWYTRAPDVLHQRERILPSGSVQIIVNLARDFIWDCPEGRPECALAPSLVVGARSQYEIVDTSDMADLIGIVFHPGGFAPFASEAADIFSNRSVGLEDLWGTRSRTLRDLLREAPTPQVKLDALESFLLHSNLFRLTRHKVVSHALHRFAQFATVRDVAADTGWSQRRFSQIFREQVGLSPKVWCRIQRFQRAVRQLHAGADVAWAELALDCGYYDQSHFANEFRAFSGIDATTYSARRSRWINHIPSDFSKTSATAAE
ncbi:MAG: helix-turn-helix domain-containing protein [Bryobacteraceae bacterium]